MAIISFQFNKKKESTIKLSYIENYFLATLSVIGAKTFSAPLERVKYLIQNQNYLVQNGVLNKKYKGIFNCIYRTISSQGIISLWKGNLPNIIKLFPIQLFNILLKDKIKRLISLKREDIYSVKLAKNIFSSGIAGTILLCIVYPLEYSRIRLAYDFSTADKSKYAGMIDFFKKSIKHKGYFSLYKGLTISCLSIFIYRGIYFGLYDTFKLILLPKTEPSFAQFFILGYLVTVVACFMSYPIDTVRTRLIISHDQVIKYTHSVDCFIKIIKYEGIRSLMNGAGVNIIRGLSGAMFLAGYDKLIQYYTGSRIESLDNTEY